MPTALLTPPAPLLPFGRPAGADASVDSTMQRVMIQVDPALRERAKREARRRGVSFPQLVREALARELALSAEPVAPPSCVGSIDTRGLARSRAYEPDPWR